jgi:hypothetical protein
MTQENAGYEAWRREVDQWCYRLVGCSLDDLADVRDRDWYDDGTEPKQAARRAIAYDQGDDDDDGEGEAYE